ncbi:DNA-processing protein DprA [Synechococcus sp. PCC 6312]|uniref:DNA-processing protein DprA n=1 Tax=Synechococcus sp. (strain ATCC 27167 / PCC 6312) TaxID=195253 RepID=UPI00029F3486|nr:DNA-processing protein DprA [Synechococcus sp. PCC 6312]AFY59488.1 DNA protecting protein DprA [Synechococcus sp. PCC 6312]
MVSDLERGYWLAWARVTGLGPVLLKRIWQRFGSMTQAWAADLQDIAQVDGIGPRVLAQLPTYRQKTNPAQLLAQHQQKNPQFWTLSDPDYPRTLAEIPDPPPILYYSGQAQSAENAGQIPMVAMVGTREPTEYGKRWTRRLAELLGRHGFVVVSGLAEGIDTQAHWGCLEGGGRTIAVLGTGVDMIYPPRNRELFGQIINQGLVISEYPSQTPPDRAHFPRRNRIIAGLCRAILIMEAPRKSGALITADMANEYGRDVYVLPGMLDNDQAIGCLSLLNRGAQVILGEGHLLELLGRTPPLDLPSSQSSQPTNLIPKPRLAPELDQVLDIMLQLNQGEINGIPFDLIVQACDLDSGAVSSALLQLELLGLVNQQPGMRYQCCCTGTTIPS